MTLEERVRRLEDEREILRLKVAYHEAVNGGWDDIPTHRGAEVAALFAPDGVYDVGPYGRTEGRDAVAAMIDSYTSIPFAFHSLANTHVELDGDHATGAWNLVMVSTTEEAAGILLCGVYDDAFERTADGWRFTRIGYTPAAVASLTDLRTGDASHLDVRAS